MGFRGLVPLSPHLCLLSVPEGGGVFRKPLKRAIWNTVGLHAVLTTCLKFVRKLRILKRNDFWNVSNWLGGAYKSSSSHLDHLQNPVLIRDDKIKWLDFGITPDPSWLCLGEVRVQ